MDKNEREKHNANFLIGKYSKLLENSTFSKNIKNALQLNIQKNLKNVEIISKERMNAEMMDAAGYYKLSDKKIVLCKDYMSSLKTYMHEATHSASVFCDDVKCKKMGFRVSVISEVCGWVRCRKCFK